MRTARNGLRPWLPALAAAALALPAPGSDSRERDFCDAWLGLAPAGRQAVLEAAEAREAGAGWDRACRTALRPGVRRKLTTECRNWPLLMDFEVRIYVDGVLEPCRRRGPPGASP